MTRGRKPQEPTPTLADTSDAAAIQRANTASQLVSAASMEIIAAAEMHKMVGRIETAHFMETVSAKIIAETYLKARALIGELGSVTVAGTNGQPETVSDIESFCAAAMPVSARRCRQIIASIELLGSELFEHAERIGFRARDYQALRALPADDQRVVKEAIASGDREAALDALADLAARNEALRRQHDEDAKALAAKDKVIAKKDAKLNQLAEEAELRRSLGTDEAGALTQVRDATVAAEIALAQLGGLIGEVLSAAPSEAAATAARQAGEYVGQRVVDLLRVHGITVDLDQPIDLGLAAGGKPSRKAGRAAS